MNLLHHPHPLPEEQDHHESPPIHTAGWGHSPLMVPSLTPRLDPVNPAGQSQKRAKLRGSCWDSGAQLPTPQPLLHFRSSRGSSHLHTCLGPAPWNPFWGQALACSRPWPPETTGGASPQASD